MKITQVIPQTTIMLCKVNLWTHDNPAKAWEPLRLYVLGGLTMNTSEGNATDRFKETNHYLDSPQPDPKRNQDDFESFSSQVDQQISTSNDIEKVRDILFGSQFRSHEKLFIHLEERIAIEYANLQDELGKRLDKIERYIKQEVESINERITTQRNAQDLALEMQAKGHNKSLQDLDRKVEKLSETAQQKHEETLALIEQEVKELYAADKSSRSKLSALFGEMSERLSAEPPE